MPNKSDSKIAPVKLGKGNPAWKPGVSGNPNGRPKGIAQLARELTNDGRLVLEFLAKVVSGEESGNTRDRIEAGKILIDRGFGKAVETTVTVDATEQAAALANLTPEQLRLLARQSVAPALIDAVPSANAPLIEGEPAHTLPASSYDAKGSAGGDVPGEGQ